MDKKKVVVRAPDTRSGDQIVYVGVDYSKAGTTVTCASYDKAVIDGLVENDQCDDIGTAQIVNIENARAAALAKLDPIDLLVLGYDPN